MAKTNWQQTTRQILDKLDVRAEYEKLGVDVTGQQPTAKGWVPCRAMGREDRSPSAGINVGDGPPRGRYKDHGGEGLSCGLFEFAAQFGQFGDWKEARRHYAKQSGVTLPRGSKAPSGPADKLAWQPWNDALAAAWCRHKPPVSVAALELAGGRLAGYPAKTSSSQVVALPIYGRHGTDMPATGWVIWNRTGRDLPLWQGKGKPIKSVKMMTVGGSVSGWMGRYGLDSLESATGVWKTEGPGDMLALMSIVPPEYQGKHIVICNSGGCAEMPAKELVEMLAGKRVAVIADLDEPGQIGGQRQAEMIAAVAEECKLVRLPGEITEKHGADLRDWINAGGTYTELLALAEAAEPITVPDQSTADTPAVVEQQQQAATWTEREICGKLEIDIWGETEDETIVGYSEHLKKEFEIRNVDRLNYSNMLQKFGPPVKEYVLEDVPEDVPPDALFVRDVRNAIGLLASYNRIDERRITGVGCWQTLGDDGHEVPGVILVRSGEAWKWNGGGSFEAVPSARDGTRLLGLSSGSAWYNVAKLQDYLSRVSPEWSSKVIGEAAEVFQRWRWSDSVSPFVCAALVLSSWVQSLWQWRPMVSVAGKTNSGKSLLFDAIAAIFGSLAEKSALSSAAGVRQGVGCSSKIVLCDEFERGKHRKEILEMFRLGSRGDTTLRGTSGQKKVLRFVIKGIAWTAAIESGLQRAADRNRFVMFELLTAEEGKHGQLVVPPNDQLQDLGMRLLAVAVANVHQACELAVRLKATQHDGIDSRVIESYAVPAAMVSAAGGDSWVESQATLAKMLKQVPRETQDISDEEDLLQIILGHEIRYGTRNQETATVAELIRMGTADALEALGRIGVKLAYDGRGRKWANAEPDYLFIGCKDIREKLLKGTDWDFQSIDQILQRIESAKRGARSVGGRRMSGVLIPMVYLNSVYFGPDSDELDHLTDDKTGNQEFT